jgi:hypothetical protein
MTIVEMTKRYSSRLSLSEELNSLLSQTKIAGPKPINKPMGIVQILQNLSITGDKVAAGRAFVKRVFEFLFVPRILSAMRCISSAMHNTSHAMQCDGSATRCGGHAMHCGNGATPCGNGAARRGRYAMHCAKPAMACEDTATLVTS